MRGRVDWESIACLLAGRSRCSAGLRLVGDEVSDELVIRGNNIVCHGPSDLKKVCCDVEMLGKDVIATGTLQHHERGAWLRVTSVCAP